MGPSLPYPLQGFLLSYLLHAVPQGTASIYRAYKVLISPMGSNDNPMLMTPHICLFNTVTPTPTSASSLPAQVHVGQLHWEISQES